VSLSPPSLQLLDDIAEETTHQKQENQHIMGSRQVP
jgi:hypothetical protein